MLGDYPIMLKKLLCLDSTTKMARNMYTFVGIRVFGSFWEMWNLLFIGVIRITCYNISVVFFTLSLVDL